jgi:Mg-chelatase subunit ChlD
MPTIISLNTKSQFGEKGNIEYAWSNDIREKIIQLSFQLTRTKRDTIDFLAIQTNDILNYLTRSYMSAIMSREEYIEYMSIMYRMIGFTRDIVEGKGEYSLAYMLVDVWYSHYPELAFFAFKHFVLAPDGTMPYGSWKDIKYFYKTNKTSPIVNYGVNLMINQIRLDINSENPSLAAKWVPREKSQYGELFTEIATNYFSEYIMTANTELSRINAINKAKMNFRKIISSINRKLDTVQIKQCDNNWSNIEPVKQTSITMHKQKRAFFNVDRKGNQRSNLEDRIICANNFKEFATRAANGEIEVNGKRIGLNDFTRDALNIIPRNNSDEAKILNAQWLNNSEQTGALGKMIAMVDVSGSMYGDPMNAAIALGIRVAEKSMLGKRLLTFSASPSWVNLDGIDNFVDMVDTVKRADWGMNTNFAAALKMILDAIITQRLKPDDVEDMVLVIFSDMQIDNADGSYQTLMTTIETQYAAAGLRIWNKPFKTPHILFWNLRSTPGFPTLSTQPNVSMMSGFSPSLLNLFCDEGLESLSQCSPWSLFMKSLNSNRYKVLDEHIRQTL